ncbi:Carboxypeptidase regulatory-like domain-containing protein [Granulicella pectinivorans]|uniref:Carboxypeptidase regulatory-like domain-containing protein n=1 Tax=Granulicella pectinivorans TaxID=474950 RepID=A0A1I6LEP5_9BACT|nr:M1 family aminopeptidase [Granulicella pectinivorans]SFS01919.1 Carboxypeptidase regulatory-like domain-containing protein [Granulicella pectinivorans]
MSLLAALLLAGLFQTATITGTVTNTATAVIPGAQVTLAPSDHPAAPITVTTAQNGTFSFAAQKPGIYTVCVEAQVFVRNCVENIVVTQSGGTSLGAIELKLQPTATQADASRANTGRPNPPPEILKPPTADDLLRGPNGPFRANNDLLYYHLDVRVDPEKKFLSGKNTIRFKMLADGDRIQIDLVQTLAVEKILFDGAPLKYTREERAVYIDFPKKLRKGKTYSIDFFYSGAPVEGGRFGGLTFKTDTAGRPWINTACEEEGASVWWPNKDQWRDEPESMDISVAVPNALTDVSNGRFVSKVDLHDGYTQWNYHVSYPINNYDVSLNIGAYAHFGTTHKGLTMDYYVLPEDLEKAKLQFAQAPAMIDAYEHYFGEYPFLRDGYKLIEVPYAGMEHQSAVTYGNHFANGYLNRDWTGVGISPRFDFIIIHESGHEWFGNAVTAADRSDMWIHEGFTTYLECLYVEYMWGHADEVTYVNALKKKVHNKLPIIPPHDRNAEPPQDMYFKGALFLNTLRSVLHDDKEWFALIHDFYQTYQYKTLMTEDVVKFFNDRTSRDLTPVFNQYLRHTEIPLLEVKLADGNIQYRWQTDEFGFAMPIQVGSRMLTPTNRWQNTTSPLTKADFEAIKQAYYIDIKID